MRIIFSAIFALIFMTSSGQYYKKRGPIFELVGGVGVTPVFADIGDFSMGPAITAGFRYRIKTHLSLKVSVHSSLFLGDDAGTEMEERGLNYLSVIAEPSAQLEYTFFKEQKGRNRHGKITTKPKVRPYIFAGGGGVYFIPDVGGEDLSEVTDDYNKFSVAVVGGIGFMHHFQPHWLWGVELGGRYITTDYIDGFSTSSSASSDMYHFVTVNLIYRWRHSLLKK